MDERRTLCMLCSGRCNPGAYTCKPCKRRLWQEIVDAYMVDERHTIYGESNGN